MSQLIPSFEYKRKELNLKRYIEIERFIVNYLETTIRYVSYGTIFPIDWLVWQTTEVKAVRNQLHGLTFPLEPLLNFFGNKPL